MTKDEARESYLNARDRVFHGGLVGIELFRARQDEVKVADAYAQACVDAALADTLGLLEEIAKVKDGRAMVWMGEEMVGVTYYGNGGFGYERSYYDGNMSHIQSCTRAEAEALLGEGKKE